MGFFGDTFKLTFPILAELPKTDFHDFPLYEFPSENQNHILENIFLLKLI